MKHTLLLLLGTVLLLAGCKKDNTTNNSFSLVGTWRDTVNMSGYQLNNTLVLSNNTFDYTMRIAGTSATMGHSAGNYTATSSQLQFQDTTNSSTSCYSTPCTYSYTKVSDMHITWGVVSDACTNRANANNGSNWYKQ
ncbi:MAG: hypothetical protein U0T84_07275 [Chitinophagales bacterium]